jgi:trehalose-6-phosphatase
MKISAIISDYDGTLCPAGDVRVEGRNRIPTKLESVLLEISGKIPVCILSSKDYGFLGDKVPFANVVSCILGIETLVISRGNPSGIKSCHLLVEEELVRSSAGALEQLARDIGAKFPGVTVERKLTHDGLLAGITFDWRNYKDWKRYSDSMTGYVKGAVSGEPHRRLYVQTYSSHPFVDVYATKCDKGLGFDRVASELGHPGAILYLGDSENDNPAFRKAEISVGVRSDERLKPKLDSRYNINYDRLAVFLRLLKDSDFRFSDNMLIQ